MRKGGCDFNGRYSAVTGRGSKFNVRKRVSTPEDRW